jgi:2'-5' RNA ligase
MRSHHSALAILPPEEIWEPIQALRRDHDRRFERWMPHINLLYPFRPESRTEEVEPLLREIAAGSEPFEFQLGEIEIFEHGRDLHSIWIAPEPRVEIDALHERARALFPDCLDVTRHESGFTPHLSVGQARGDGELDRVLADVRRRWRPLSVRVDRISWVVRRPAGSFVTRTAVVFG